MALALKVYAACFATFFTLDLLWLGVVAKGHGRCLVCPSLRLLA